MQVDEYDVATKTWDLTGDTDTRLDNPKYIYFGRNGLSSWICTISFFVVRALIDMYAIVYAVLPNGT